MARKFQGKLHVGRRVQRQKNGDIYVLERTTRYDQATKKTVTVAQKLLGKIVAGTTKMVPTRAKRPDGSAGGAARVSFDNAAVRGARKYFGFFALVSNQPMDTFEALRNYRLRERVEEFFGMDKRYFDGRRTRLWSADALRGRQFVQFVGLCCMSRFRRMVDDIMDGLGEPRDGATKDRLKLEKSLKGWIKARSTQDIFDWFDCVETKEVQTEAGKFRWSTESIRRDELFLELLGVPRRE